MEITSQMDIDEEDVYATGIIDRYSVRPNSVEDMCYADFGALFTTPTIETPSEDTNIMAEEVQCEEKSLRFAKWLMICQEKNQTSNHQISQACKRETS